MPVVVEAGAASLPGAIGAGSADRARFEFKAKPARTRTKRGWACFQLPATDSNTRGVRPLPVFLAFIFVFSLVSAFGPVKIPLVADADRNVKQFPGGSSAS